MDTKDENFLVKVVKKAVGLPTRDSSCGCGTPVKSANACCGIKANEIPSAECACEHNTAQRPEEQPTQP